MKHDFPQGSVFGGYGFFSYSALPDRPRSTGTATPVATRSSSNPGGEARRSFIALLTRWLRF